MSQDLTTKIRNAAAFDAKRIDDQVDWHFKKTEQYPPGIVVAQWQHAQSAWQREALEKLIAAQTKAINLLLEPHNTGNAYDARNLMENALTEIAALVPKGEK